MHVIISPFISSFPLKSKFALKNNFSFFFYYLFLFFLFIINIYRSFLFLLLTISVIFRKSG